MKIPQGKIEEIRDSLKSNYSITCRVWTHNGLRAYWTRGRFQIFKEAVYIKLFSNRESYVCPDLKFERIEKRKSLSTDGIGHVEDVECIEKRNGHVEDVRRLDMRGWNQGKVEDDSGGAIYELYLASNYELYAIDIRQTEIKGIFEAWERKVKTYQDKMRLLVPAFPESEEKVKQEQEAEARILGEREEARKEMDAAFASLKNNCLRENVFFEPQLSPSAVQSLVAGFAAIFEYMRDQMQENMMLISIIGLIVVCLVLGGGAWLYYDNSGRMTQGAFNAGQNMVSALPSYIQECARAGYVNLTRPGV